MPAQGPMISIVADYQFGRGRASSCFLKQGWAAPDEGFVCSAGAHSTLTLPPADGTGRLELELSVAPHLLRPSLLYQHIQLSVNGTVIDARRLGGPLDWWLDIPAEAARGPLDISFYNQDHVTRHPAGARAGDTAPHIKLSRAVLFRDTDAPAPTPLHNAHEIRIGWNETTEQYLLSGWGKPEDRYAWAIGRSSTLRVPVDGSGAPVLALLDMRPYLEPPALTRQRFVVGVDDKLVTYLDLPCHTSVAVRLTPAPGQTSVVLRFDHLDADAGNPALRHHHRLPFAFMLFSVRVLPAPPLVPHARLPAIGGTMADGSLQAEVRRLTGLTAEQLVGNFESLGNSCAVGLLQQQMGVARPGLLQFAEWWQPRLVDALIRDFTQLGRPDKLEWVERHKGDSGWLVRDQIYALGSPTPHDKNVPVPPYARAREARRLPRLAAKLLEDAAEFSKIFVLRTGDPLTEPGALAVRAALARHGDVTVLWLNDGPPEMLGSAEQIGHGLLRGYHPRGGPPMDTLLSALANAWRLRQVATAAPSEEGKSVLF